MMSTARERRDHQNLLREQAKEASEMFSDACPDLLRPIAAPAGESDEDKAKRETLNETRLPEEIAAPLEQLQEHLVSTQKYLAHMQGIHNNTMGPYFAETDTAIEDTEKAALEALAALKEGAINELGINPSDEAKKEVEDLYKKKEEAVKEHLSSVRDGNTAFYNSMLESINQSRLARSVEGDNITARAVGGSNRGEPEVMELKFKRSGLEMAGRAAESQLRVKQNMNGAAWLLDSYSRTFTLRVVFDPKKGTMTLDPKIYAQLGREKKARTKQIAQALKDPSKLDQVLNDPSQRSQRENYWALMAEKLLGNGSKDVTLPADMPLLKKLEGMKYLMLHSRGVFPMKEAFKDLESSALGHVLSKQEQALLDEVYQIKRAIVEPTQRNMLKLEGTLSGMAGQEVATGLRTFGTYQTKSEAVNKSQLALREQTDELVKLKKEVKDKYGDDSGSPLAGLYERLRSEGGAVAEADFMRAMPGGGGHMVPNEAAQTMVGEVLKNYEQRFEKIAKAKEAVEALCEQANELLEFAAESEDVTDEQRQAMHDHAEGILNDANTQLRDLNQAQTSLLETKNRLVQRVEAVSDQVKEHHKGAIAKVQTQVEAMEALTETGDKLAASQEKLAELERVINPPAAGPGM